MNVFKRPYYKSKLEFNTSINIFPEVTNMDVQLETLKVWKSVFIPFCLIPYVLNKNLTPRKTFLLLHPLIQTGGLIYCDSVLDFIQVVGKLPTGDLIPLLALDKAWITYIMDWPLRKFTQKQVMEWDLKAMQPVTTCTDPVVQELYNVIVTMIETQFSANASNKWQRIDNEKPKVVEDCYKGSRLEWLHNWWSGSPNKHPH